jgi:predicted lactoylglutathione lyase
VADARVLPIEADPAETVALRQSIRLAFVAALQHLSTRQRAVLLLTEVLGWSVAEAAARLDASVSAINSALQRARETLATRDLGEARGELTPAQAALVDRYVEAFERYDVDALTALLRSDAVLSMPPYTLWLRGPDAIRAWLLGRGADCRGSRLVATSACGPPAFGQYRPSPYAAPRSSDTPLASCAASASSSSPASRATSSRAPPSSAPSSGPGTSAAPSRHTSAWAARASATRCFRSTSPRSSGRGSGCATAACARSSVLPPRAADPTRSLHQPFRRDHAMTTTHARQFFVNLPVRDLARSREFFASLGFEFNSKFTDQNAACMIVGKDAFVMLLVEPFFKTFTKQEICDTSTHAEALFTISCESRAAVDEMVKKALAAGGGVADAEPHDHGFMYDWGFYDLDRHGWGVMWMDPNAAQSPDAASVTPAISAPVTLPTT